MPEPTKTDQRILQVLTARRLLTADQRTRLERTMASDGIPLSEALRRVPLVDERDILRIEWELGDQPVPASGEPGVAGSVRKDPDGTNVLDIGLTEWTAEGFEEEVRLTVPGFLPDPRSDSSASASPREETPPGRETYVAVPMSSPGEKARGRIPPRRSIIDLVSESGESGASRPPDSPQAEARGKKAPVGEYSLLDDEGIPLVGQVNAALRRVLLDGLGGLRVTHRTGDEPASSLEDLDSSGNVLNRMTLGDELAGKYLQRLKIMCRVQPMRRGRNRGKAYVRTEDREWTLILDSADDAGGTVLTISFASGRQ